MNQSVEPLGTAGTAGTTDLARAPGDREPPALNAIPRQPDPHPRAAAGPAVTASPPAAKAATPVVGGPVPPVTAAAATASVGVPAVTRPRPRLWRLLPGPRRTPFTFGYALVLTATSLLGRYADPQLVDALLRGSSTDVAHLAHNPLLVLVASALWIAGGITSPYAIAFLLVLTALERRIGGLRTAGVFLLGHVVATLATEVPVGLSVLAGHLPGSSLHRLDYGISFGVAASVGALAGLLTPWLRWAVLAGFGWMLVEDLIAFTDPMTDWGHLLALAVGVCTWPLLRRGRPFLTPARPAPRRR
ncbi:rhomboid-like protein [Streptomyces sp. NPDC017988]|uniref:rhomboid-like protein n=1 Tax=Streptomyces sp. NPDC017988 TaxID=3365025 RepID=UPI00379BCABF